MLRKTFFLISIILMLFLTISSCLASEDISADLTDGMIDDNDKVSISYDDLASSNEEMDDVGYYSDLILEDSLDDDVDSSNLILGDSADDGVLQIDGAASNTFSDLNDLISRAQSGSTVALDINYIYNKGTDSSYDDGITLNKNLVIDGKGHYIDGKSLARAFIIKNCSIVLRDLTIKNGYREETKSGGVMLLYEGADITIRNCNFTNNKVYRGNGGVINANPGASIKIYQSNFINNKAVHKSNLPWTSFKSGMGSVIRAYGCPVSIYDSYFSGNSGHVTTVLVVSHSDGHFHNANLHVDNCVFENNHATNQGVIYLDEFGQGKILNSVFRNNPTGDGGTVILDTSKSALVQNCLFEGNSGTNAGAINVKVYKDSLRSNVVIDKCTFIRNTVKEHGGAINLGGGNAKITNCNFVSNTAKKWAGAIYAHLGTITISSCNFTSNKGSYGGGVALINMAKSVITNSNFNKNTSPKGGTLIVDTCKSVSIKNSKFISNKGEFGAAIYIKLNNKKVKLKVTVNKCTFTKNSVSVQGGAICLMGGTLKLTNSVFTSNTARTYGGALAVRSGTLSASKCKFVSNVAKYAGAVYIVSGKAKVKYSRFTKNAAKAKYPYAFSKVKKVFSKCSYRSNFLINAKVSLVKSGKYMKVTIKNNKGKALNKKFRLLFKGPKKFNTKLYKTKKGRLKVKIPKLQSGTYEVSIKVLKAKYLPVSRKIKI